MRENRTYGSEGGGGTSRSLPLSADHDAPLEWRAPSLLVPRIQRVAQAVA